MARRQARRGSAKSGSHALLSFKLPGSFAGWRSPPLPGSAATCPSAVITPSGHAPPGHDEPPDRTQK